ncbi:MAG: hypothetical protein K8R36_13275 [Planctomycetales bacterium]|nr:hypothetical protein [Planctomycetales bacterium]
MRWHKSISILLLLSLAALLAVANTWYTAVRSTIPLALDTTVLRKEVRREKHEGKDDVFLLELKGLGQIQVDREIYESTAIGETLKKERHSTELRHGDQALILHGSRDYQGMLAAMPLCMVALAALLAVSIPRLHGGSADSDQPTAKSRDSNRIRT